MAGFADAAFAGTVLEVETAFLPRISVDLAAEVNAPTGFVTKLLRPRYTIRRQNVVLLTYEPAGSPGAGVTAGTLALLALAAVAVWLVFRTR
jgi:hypothetical protein